jgi:hypothetical protein
LLLDTVLGSISYFKDGFADSHDLKFGAGLVWLPDHYRPTASRFGMKVDW